LSSSRPLYVACHNLWHGTNSRWTNQRSAGASPYGGVIPRRNGKTLVCVKLQRETPQKGILSSGVATGAGAGGFCVFACAMQLSQGGGDAPTGQPQASPGQSGSARRLSATTDDCDGPVRAAPGKRRKTSRAPKGRNKVRRGRSSTDRQRSLGAGVLSSRGGRRARSALFRPFRARMVWGRVPRAARIGLATFLLADNRAGADPLCPGLACGCPVGACRLPATMTRHRGCRSPRMPWRKQCARNGGMFVTRHVPLAERAACMPPSAKSPSTSGASAVRDVAGRVSRATGSGRFAR